MGRVFQRLRSSMKLKINRVTTRAVNKLKAKVATMKAAVAHPAAKTAAHKPKASAGGKGFALELQAGEDETDAHFRRA